ncbi:MAG TPA: hypothetical protein VK464_24320 [Symbiobacteriaceae bacterium]|nr:hypothetical protein [Symbiobacteriaceae bacterium]
MKAKSVLATMALLLTVSSFSSVALARASAVTSAQARAASPAGLYDNLPDFKAAVEKLPGSTAGDHMSDAAKQARREAISKALGSVARNDRAAMQAQAEKFGLVIYDPNLNQVSTNSYEQDVTMASPRITWDNQSGEYGFWGTAEWVNGDALWDDTPFWSNNIGGPDGYGLIFTSIANDGYITSSYVQQWDSMGRYIGLYSTKSYTPKSLPGPYAFTIRVQDTWKGTANGYCTCWKSEIWAWMTPQAFGSGSVRNAYTYYAHDYNDTQLSGMELSLDGSVGPNEEKVGGSFKLIWNLTTDKWAAESSATMY